MHWFHWQELLQVCLPPLPHAWPSFGLHSPCIPQPDQADHTPLLHVRVCVPHLSQLCVFEPLQVWPVQLPHVQALLQLCLPPVPHACVEFGEHSPCWVQLDQLDQVPVALLQVRVCVPQFSQLRELSPTHT